MKTSELTGQALDWAVAKCLFKASTALELLDGDIYNGYAPSTDWTQGGPIIERQRIAIRGDGNEGWWADMGLRGDVHGTTPLIAAMRCYVVSKLGDEVEIPEELTC